MKYLTYLVIFSILHSSIFGQQNFDPGYIIKNNRDTVRGFIQIALEADLCRSVKFQNANGESKEFIPSDILGFGLGNELYQSMRFLNAAEDNIQEYAFVKQLVKGDYNLYAYVKTNRRFYLLQKDSTRYFLYDRVSTNLGQIDQEGNYYNYLHFISVACEKLSNLYDRVGFNDQDMAAFVLRVDNCISEGKATSFYQKPKTQIQPVIFVGGSPVSGMTQFTANFSLQFTLPRIDKKTSFNVGFYYSYTNVQSTERSDYYNLYTLVSHNQVFSVPVTFQYNFTTTRLQPYFYAGLSGAYIHTTANSFTSGIPALDTKFGLALVAGIGVEAKLSTRLFIRADWRFEVFLQHPALGLAYKF